MPTDDLQDDLQTLLNDRDRLLNELRDLQGQINGIRREQRSIAKAVKLAAKRAKQEAIRADSNAKIQEAHEWLHNLRLHRPSPDSIARLLSDVGYEYDYLPDASVVDATLASLKPHEEYVLRLRYGLGNATPLRPCDIARQMSLSPERVRQIRLTALRKCRHPSRRRQLLPLIAS